MRPGCAFPATDARIKATCGATCGFAGGATKLPCEQNELRGGHGSQGHRISPCKGTRQFDSVTLTDTPRRVDCGPRGPRPANWPTRGTSPQIASGSTSTAQRSTPCWRLSRSSGSQSQESCPQARALAAFDQHLHALDIGDPGDRVGNGRVNEAVRCQRWCCPWAASLRKSRAARRSRASARSRARCEKGGRWAVCARRADWRAKAS